MEPEKLTVEQLLYSYRKLLEVAQYYSYAFNEDGVVDEEDLEEMTLTRNEGDNHEDVIVEFEAKVGGKKARETLVHLSDYYSPGHPERAWLL